MAVALFRISFSISTWANFFCSLRYSATVTVSPFSVNPILPYSFFYRYINDSLMPYSLLISLAVLPCSFNSIICRLNSFVYCFRFITIFQVLLYNLLYFYPYLLSHFLYQIQENGGHWEFFSNFETCEPNTTAREQLLNVFGNKKNKRRTV